MGNLWIPSFGSSSTSPSSTRPSSPEIAQLLEAELAEWAIPDGHCNESGRPTNAAGSRPGVAWNSNLQGQIENMQGQAQSALDIGQNVIEDFASGGDDGVFES